MLYRVPVTITITGFINSVSPNIDEAVAEVDAIIGQWKPEHFPMEAPGMQYFHDEQLKTVVERHAIVGTTIK
jgi:hypothetical protein